MDTNFQINAWTTQWIDKLVARILASYDARTEQQRKSTEDLLQIQREQIAALNKNV